jgi:membrane protein DedA with SNARE-associated domain
VVGIEVVGVPLPGETALVTAAIYAGVTHHLNPAVVVLAAICGAVVGYSLAFLVGHWGGYRLVVRFGHYVRLDQPKVKLARYLFKRHGGKVVFLGRFVPILRAYGAFLAGTSRMSWRPFSVFNIAGAVAWASLYGAGAFLLGHALEQASRGLAIVIGAIAAVLIISLVFLMLRHERRLEETAEKAIPGPLEGYPGGAPL